MCDGLKPIEVLALMYAPTKTPSDTRFECFWDYTYNVNNLGKILKNLQNKGYLEIGTLEDSVSKDLGKNLKELLKEYGLPLSGKKEVLANRVIANVPRQELEKMYTKRYYVLTPKAEKIVQDYHWIKDIHKIQTTDYIEGININNFTSRFLESKKPWKEVLKDAYIDLAITSLEDKNFWEYIVSKRNMANLLIEEGNYDKALDYLLEQAYYYVSGLYYVDYDESIRPDFPYITPPDELPLNIKEVQNALNLTDKQLEDRMLKKFTNSKLPTRIKNFTPEICTQIYMEAKDGNEEKVNQILGKLQKQKNEIYLEY